MVEYSLKHPVSNPVWLLQKEGTGCFNLFSGDAQKNDWRLTINGLTQMCLEMAMKTDCVFVCTGW